MSCLTMGCGSNSPAVSPASQTLDRQQIADQRPDSADSWHACPFDELSIESPVQLKKSPTRSLGDRITIELLEGGRSKTLTVRLQKFTFPIGTPYDLNVGSHAVTKEIAIALGDQAPNISTRRINVAGYPARRSSCQGTGKAGLYWIDNVTVLRHNCVFVILVLRVASEQRELTERVLGSIKISGPELYTPDIAAEAEQTIPFDPNYRYVKEWIAEKDDGYLEGIQAWWPVADQEAFYQELRPKYAAWRIDHPGKQQPPVEFAELYEHEHANAASGKDEPLLFPKKLLRLRYLLNIDGRIVRKDRVFVLNDGVVRRVTESDVVFLKSYSLIESIREDMLLAE